MIFLISLAVAFVVAALLRRSQVRLASVAAGAFTALAALAVGVGSDWSAGLDTSVAEWFDARRTSREDAEAGAAFGYVGRPFHVLTAAAVFGLPLSLRRRSVRPIGLIFGAVAVGVLVEQTLKATIGRSATSGVLAHYTHSFPSGHVTGTAALLGSIAVCLGAGRSRAVKTVLAGLVVTAVLAVAWLALYIGAHTFTDVIGGMLLGGGIVAVCGLVYGSGAKGH
ncbi:phosphatase PAP2 family protein [Mycolicibacterium sp.]|uniref:phosphatase PAP2 family protein n=1 Tax=Mycolicibacterium sp. TaxID=2320850 RepID=UPI0028B02AD0|nr:phosphatase PAP2 family protein [Mycolicibacterium sp.]